MNITERILNCQSVAASSEKMTSVLRDELCGLGYEYTGDALDNSSFTMKIGEGRTLMLCTGIDVEGVIATYIDASKIYVGALGHVDVHRLAYSKVVFDGISGIFMIPDGCSSSTAVSDCYVETYDDKVSDKVKQGDKGYFDVKINSLESVAYWGLGVGVKACVALLCDAAKMLASEEGLKLLESKGIGSITVAFLGQSSLMSRGASVASFGINPDDVILLSPYDCKKDSNIKKGDRAVVKMLDKAYISDPELVGEICAYFDEKKFSYKKAINTDSDPALRALSKAESTPRCAEIGIPVFGGELVFINC